jgi:hypothetical protein
MAKTVQVLSEAGKRRTFVSALEWPGWCRGARTEDEALEQLVVYGQRYADAIAATGLLFSPPETISALAVVERTQGDSGTDFGMPAIVMDADHAGLDDVASERLLGVLQACWATFDAVAAAHDGVELRKGPRGGGREVEAIVDHVLGADGAYLRSLGGRWKDEESAEPSAELSRLRADVVEIWNLRRAGEPTPRIPRKGAKPLWPVRYYARRSAWHALDHAWEIEDRAVT